MGENATIFCKAPYIFDRLWPMALWLHVEETSDNVAICSFSQWRNRPRAAHHWVRSRKDHSGLCEVTFYKEYVKWCPNGCRRRMQCSRLLIFCSLFLSRGGGEGRIHYVWVLRWSCCQASGPWLIHWGKKMATINYSPGKHKVNATRGQYCRDWVWKMGGWGV